MLSVIIVRINDGLIYLIFEGELIWQVQFVLQVGEVGEIDQFNLTVCRFQQSCIDLFSSSLLD
jgi:hypothetical protein